MFSFVFNSFGPWQSSGSLFEFRRWRIWLSNFENMTNFSHCVLNFCNTPKILHHLSIWNISSCLCRKSVFIPSTQASSTGWTVSGWKPTVWSVVGLLHTCLTWQVPVPAAGSPGPGPALQAETGTGWAVELEGGELPGTFWQVEPVQLK